MKNKKEIDVNVIRSGSCGLFTLNTKAAKEWADENVHMESWQWTDEKNFVVDSRFAQALIVGMKEEGLEVCSS